jgi:protein-disulfide isomerase
MRPVVDGLDERYGDRVAFAGIDFYNQENRGLAERYGALGHPTFVVVGADGAVIETFTGYTEEPDLEAAIQRAAATAQ